MAFYYFAGVDTVGVRSPLPRGDWFGLTTTPLSIPLHFVLSAILLGLVPVVSARLLYHRSLRDLGLGLGRWRLGLMWLAAGLPVAAFLAWTGAGTPALRAVYPLDPTMTDALGRFAPFALMQLLYYGSWEVLFRGALLLGLAPQLGEDGANAVQTALSVTAHFGRPFLETLLALPAGFVLGKIALRVRSVWYLAVVHWALAVSLDWLILRG
jgi:hypothetical protein